LPRAVIAWRTCGGADFEQHQRAQGKFLTGHGNLFDWANDQIFSAAEYPGCHHRLQERLHRCGWDIGEVKCNVKMSGWRDGWRPARSDPGHSTPAGANIIQTAETGEGAAANSGRSALGQRGDHDGPHATIRASISDVQFHAGADRVLVVMVIFCVPAKIWATVIRGGASAAIIELFGVMNCRVQPGQSFPDGADDCDGVCGGRRDRDDENMFAHEKKKGEKAMEGRIGKLQADRVHRDFAELLVDSPFSSAAVMTGIVGRLFGNLRFTLSVSVRCRRLFH